MRTRAEASVEVDADPETAFRIFTEEVDLWWVRGPINFYDASRLAELRMEPGQGGRVVEVYGNGDLYVRQRITVWEPGSRLMLRSADMEVDIRFASTEKGTRVDVAQYLLPDGDPKNMGFGWANMLGGYDAWTRRRDGAPRQPRELDRLGLALYYDDPGEAARWLRSTFQLGDWDIDGAPGEGESPDWIEFHVGNALVLLFGSTDRTHNTWVYVDDVNAHYEHAKAAGAKIVSEPRLHGTNKYVAEDLEGHRWTFVQARPTMRLGPGKVDELTEALEQHDEDRAKSLVLQVDPRATNLMLHRFARDGDAEAIRLLMDLGADVNAVDDRGATALHFAAAEGHLDCARVLIDARADLDPRDYEHASSPVLWARNFDRNEMVQLLLDRGARLNTADAAKLGLNHVVAGFLDDVPESRDRAVGWPTPLTGAISGGHPDTVRLLLDRGADPNAPTGTGGTPLDSLRWVDDETARADIEALLREHL